MITTAFSHQDRALRDMPFLLSLVDERQTQSHVSDLVSQVTRLVAQRLSVTTESSPYRAEQADNEHAFTDMVYSRLTICLQQGYRRLLLVPWGDRQSMGSLLKPAHLALSTVTGEAVSRTGMALPHVHIDGVSARSVFEGFVSIQAQLSPLMEAFPGWDRTWTRLSAGDVKLVLLRSGEWTKYLSQGAAWEMPTMKALTAALCPQQAGFMTASERSRWQRDGEIYAHYLVSLLCAATEFLQQEQVSSHCL